MARNRLNCFKERFWLEGYDKALRKLVKGQEEVAHPIVEDEDKPEAISPLRMKVIIEELSYNLYYWKIKGDSLKIVDSLDQLRREQCRPNLFG